VYIDSLGKNLLELQGVEIGMLRAASLLNFNGGLSEQLVGEEQCLWSQVTSLEGWTSGFSL
jgi:hypothetical protein